MKDSRETHRVNKIRYIRFYYWNIWIVVVLMWCKLKVKVSLIRSLLFISVYKLSLIWYWNTYRC